MIDLTKEGLPNAIEVNGSPYFIKTDFREWLKFAEIMQNEYSTMEDLLYLFVDELPKANPMVELMEFYMCTEYTPNSLDDDDEESEELISWSKDGSYIYASFLAEYGIDLIDIKELHWHKFMALFRGLSDESKIKHIMSMRGYQEDKLTYEQSMNRMKQVWSLGYKKEKEEQQKLLDEFNNL